MPKINFFFPLREKLSQIFDEKSAKVEKLISIKEDKSIVTEVDTDFSEEIKAFFKDTIYKDFTFYSEEDFSSLTFPAIIVDPIDGTIELSKGIPECAVSIALMQNHDIEDPQNVSWLYNPFTKSEASTLNILRNEISSEKLLGFVSRTEWSKGTYTKYAKSLDFEIRPVGSIAYKLMLLSCGLCDFVITKKNKHIWDIAGGTILASRHGIKLFNKDGVVNKLKEKEIIGPLLWCSEKNYPDLKDFFFENE